MSTPRERVQAVLEGRRPDHLPTSCWHHFAPNQMRGQAAVEAHLRHLERYRLDFLKVMNDHHYPRGGVGVLAEPADLHTLAALGEDPGPLAGQLEVLRELRRRLGPQIPMCTTIFNAWTVMRNMCRPPSDVHGPPKLTDAIDERDETLTRLLQADRSAFAAALQAVGRMLAVFARQCLAAGADGIFLSVRDDWVDRPVHPPGTYKELVRPADLMILEAAAGGTFNVLHICGKPLDFRGFADYPVHVLNWADRAAGPSIAYARDRVKPQIAGGVDNLKTLPEGTPQQVAAEVADALRQAGSRPILVTPGCTYDPHRVPEANIEAMIAAVRAA